MTLKFELGVDLLTMHLPTKLHHPVINHSEVIVLTGKQANKQRDSAENNRLDPLCFAGRKNAISSSKSFCEYLEL